MRAMASVCVIDNNIGHLAPWSATFHEYKDDKIIWEDKEQELYFFHFAHFTPDVSELTYRTSYNDEWIWGAPEKANLKVKDLYDEYFSRTLSTLEKYEGLGLVS